MRLIIEMQTTSLIIVNMGPSNKDLKSWLEVAALTKARLLTIVVLINLSCAFTHTSGQSKGDGANIFPSQPRISMIICELELGSVTYPVFKINHSFAWCLTSAIAAKNKSTPDLNWATSQTAPGHWPKTLDLKCLKKASQACQRGSGAFCASALKADIYAVLLPPFISLPAKVTWHSKSPFPARICFAIQSLQDCLLLGVSFVPLYLPFEHLLLRIMILQFCLCWLLSQGRLPCPPGQGKLGWYDKAVIQRPAKGFWNLTKWKFERFKRKIQDSAVHLMVSGVLLLLVLLFVNHRSTFLKGIMPINLCCCYSVHRETSVWALLKCLRTPHSLPFCGSLCKRVSQWEMTTAVVFVLINLGLWMELSSGF